MVIINQPRPNDNTYIVSLGVGTEYQHNFTVFASNQVEAVERLADYLIAQNYHDQYFDALEVNLMASSKHQTMQEFAKAYDLYHCPKHHIYLPDVGVQEVSI